MNSIEQIISFRIDSIRYQFKFNQNQSISIRVQGNELNYETEIRNSDLSLYQIDCTKLYKHIYFQYLFEGHNPNFLCQIYQQHLYLRFSFPKRAINTWSCSLNTKPSQFNEKNHKVLDEARVYIPSNNPTPVLEDSVKYGLTLIQQKLLQATHILQQKIQKAIHQIEGIFSQKQNQDYNRSRIIVNQFHNLCDEKLNASLQKLAFENIKFREEISLIINKCQNNIATINQNQKELSQSLVDLTLDQRQNMDEIQEQIHKLEQQSSNQIKVVTLKLQNLIQQLQKQNKKLISIKDKNQRKQQTGNNIHFMAEKTQFQQSDLIDDQEEYFRQSRSFQLKGQGQGQGQGQDQDQFAVFYRQESQKYNPACMRTDYEEKVDWDYCQQNKGQANFSKNLSLVS